MVVSRQKDGDEIWNSICVFCRFKGGIQQCGKKINSEDDGGDGAGDEGKLMEIRWRRELVEQVREF